MLSGDSEDGPPVECPVLPQIFVGGMSEWTVFANQGVFETVHARGCAPPRLPQLLHLLRVWLERDLSHPSHEADDHCDHISVGDVRDGTGVAVVQIAVDAESHQCARVAEFAEAQTRRTSRRLWRLSMMTRRSQIRTQTALCMLGETNFGQSKFGQT